MGKNIHDYVKSYEGCQKNKPVPRYRTTLSQPLTGLFQTFSIDFAGPLPRTAKGNRFLLIAVEHLTGWPIARATAASTADVVLNFVKDEIIYSFGPPTTIVSDNAGCFTAATLANFMRSNGIDWKTVLEYSPMSNCGAIYAANANAG